VIVADLEFGCTVTQIRRAMDEYIGHNAALINPRFILYGSLV